MLASLCVCAQKTKPHYAVSAAVGFNGGNSEPAFAGQLVNGIQYKTWSAGIGVGLDYYHTRSVPVFLALRKAALAKPKTAFFYADAGYNKPWLHDDDKFLVKKGKGGFYGEGGVGYAQPAFKTKTLFMSLGWRVKKLTRVTNVMPYLSIWPPPETAWRDYDYTLTTLALKLGLTF